MASSQPQQKLLPYAGWTLPLTLPLTMSLAATQKQTKALGCTATTASILHCGAVSNNAFFQIGLQTQLQPQDHFGCKDGQIRKFFNPGKSHLKR